MIQLRVDEIKPTTERSLRLRNSLLVALTRIRDRRSEDAVDQASQRVGLVREQGILLRLDDTLATDHALLEDLEEVAGLLTRGRDAKQRRAEDAARAAATKASRGALLPQVLGHAECVDLLLECLVASLDLHPLGDDRLERLCGRGRKTGLRQLQGGDVLRLTLLAHALDPPARW